MTAPGHSRPRRRAHLGVRTGEWSRPVVDAVAVAVAVPAAALAGVMLGAAGRPQGWAWLVGIAAAVVLGAVLAGAVLRLRRSYARVERLSRFTERLHRQRDAGDAVASVLAELCAVLGAPGAELVLLTRGGWQRTTRRPGTGDTETATGPGTPAEVAAATAGPVAVTALTDRGLRARLEGRLGPGAHLSPLRIDGRIVGAVAAAAPGARGRWSAGDLRLLDTLATHAAVSIDNSRLLDQLRRDSVRDRLTGLPNRSRLAALLSEAASPVAALVIDLDHFTDVNDTLGHDHGDLLLRAAAARLVRAVGDAGRVGRLAGDEFAVVLPGCGRSDAVQVAVTVLGALEQPFGVEGLSLELTASIGVAVADGPSDRPARLLQQADVAMRAAKASRGGWELYTPGRDPHSPRRLALAGDLRRAIDDGQLQVHLQPIAGVATGRVESFEALARWAHPRFGMVPPDEFVPLAEGAGLIRPLTSAVLDQAVRHLRSLRCGGHDVHVAVNLSVRSVLDVQLPDRVAELLAGADLPTSALTLEVTESSVMSDPVRTIGVLGRLADLGVSVAVDDFGTGHSSLAYLARLPVSEVKIDRSFVAGMLTSTSDDAIVRATVDLAHDLGLRAVAEGVEDPATLAALARIGCDCAQGWYVGRPMPAADAGAWLAAHPAPGRPGPQAPPGGARRAPVGPVAERSHSPQVAR